MFLAKAIFREVTSLNFSEDRFCEKHFVRSLKEFHHCVLILNVNKVFGNYTTAGRAFHEMIARRKTLFNVADFLERGHRAGLYFE